MAFLRWWRQGEVLLICTLNWNICWSNQCVDTYRKKHEVSCLTITILLKVILPYRRSYLNWGIWSTVKYNYEWSYSQNEANVIWKLPENPLYLEQHLFPLRATITSKCSGKTGELASLLIIQCRSARAGRSSKFGQNVFQSITEEHKTK